MKALITRKIGMTSAISETGVVQAVTLLSAAPNVITQIKNEDKDGYRALQLGAFVGKSAGRRTNKPRAGHLKPANPPAGGTAGEQPKLLREFKISEPSDELKVGQKLSADLFNVGDAVSVTGISKGKGFAGTIKRHNFKRGRKTHGGRSYRRPGSIGSMYPQKIFKGKKMSGQMGHSQVTTRNLKVALVNTELAVIGVAGAVPGPRKGIVLIREAK